MKTLNSSRGTPFFNVVLHEPMLPWRAMKTLNSSRGTPFFNVVLHEPMLAVIGTLPALFGLFLHGQGHTPGKRTNAALNRIKKHLRLRWTTYQRLVHTARRQADADAATLAAAAVTLPPNHLLHPRRTLPDRQATVEHPAAALLQRPSPLGAT
jgi:hypothetical protein